MLNPWFAVDFHLKELAEIGDNRVCDESQMRDERVHFLTWKKVYAGEFLGSVTIAR